MSSPTRILLDVPGHIRAGLVPQLPLRYVWDDTRASGDFRRSADWVVQAMSQCCLRARLVLCMGLYEWVLWRFEGLHADPTPLQVAQAGWCATFDPRFLRYFELPRSSWSGPVGGPLWCAIAWLRPALASGDNHPEVVDEGLDCLARLALHVVPEQEVLEAWLEATVHRLVQAFPATTSDPLEDIFDRYVGLRRGPWIARSALEPHPDLDEEAAGRWLRALYLDATEAGNPFLMPRKAAAAR